MARTGIYVSAGGYQANFLRNWPADSCKLKAVSLSRFLDRVRSLQNCTFCPISVSGSNFDPRNILYIPVVEIFAFLKLKQKLPFFKGLRVNKPRKHFVYFLGLRIQFFIPFLIQPLLSPMTATAISNAR